MQDIVEENAYREARRILRSLLLGADPETNARLSPECVVMQPETKVALALGLEALQTTEWVRRWKKKKSTPANDSRQILQPRRPVQATSRGPSRAGVGWSEREDAEIRSAYLKGAPVDAIARGQQRTAEAIGARLVRLGLVASRKDAR